jgi:hypothetical protein
MTVAGHPKALIPCDKVLGKPSTIRKAFDGGIVFSHASGGVLIQNVVLVSFFRGCWRCS